MSEKIQTTGRGSGEVAGGEQQWPGIDSRFRLVVVAVGRSKQLLRGARPRIDADPRKRRNTSIALEEVKQGLVSFTDGGKEHRGNGDVEGVGERDERNNIGAAQENLRRRVA